MGSQKANRIVPYLQHFHKFSWKPVVYDEDNIEETVRDGLIDRIEGVNESNSPEWGRMSVLLVLKHNNYWNTWMLGNENHV